MKFSDKAGLRIVKMSIKAMTEKQLNQLEAKLRALTESKNKDVMLSMLYAEYDKRGIFH
jgi:hypothetical protein